MLFQGLECVLNCWNAIGRVGIPLYRVGMLSTELEYLCTGLEYICTGLKCFLEGLDAFSRFGMRSRLLECYWQSWNTFVQGWNAF
jgi:hypothetical protein